jgi:hypothetical protein
VTRLRFGLQVALAGALTWKRSSYTKLRALAVLQRVRNVIAVVLRTMTWTETIDVGQTEFKLEALDVSWGDCQLGDGIELPMEVADRLDHLKFEFGNVFGRVREPFDVREESWHCLLQGAHARSRRMVVETRARNSRTV